MMIALACDHTGVALKAEIAAMLDSCHLWFTAAILLQYGQDTDGNYREIAANLAKTLTKRLKFDISLQTGNIKNSSIGNRHYCHDSCLNRISYN